MKKAAALLTTEMPEKISIIRKFRDEVSESWLRESSRKWFRSSGGILQGLKWTVGGLVACKMGRATCQGVSTLCILAWEHKLAASLLAQSRDF